MKVKMFKKEMKRTRGEKKRGKKKKEQWFGWGSNPGPLACEASVITTTLPNRLSKKRTI